MRLSRRASIAAAVAAAAVVAAVLTIGGGDPATVVAASTSSPTTTSTTAAPATTSTTLSSTSTSPTTSTSTSPPPPTTTTTSLPRTLELRAEQGTITFEVMVEPAYPRAGELVRFHIEATDSEGGIMVLGFDAGDRRQRSRLSAPTVACVPADPDAPRQERTPTVRSASIDYVYRVAAERHITVMAATGSCSRESHYAELEGTITVLPGETTSNGPRPPEGSLGENPEGAPANGVRMSVGAWDDDGVVRRVHVDWGDGSEPSVLDVAEGGNTCVDEPTAYPTSGDTHTLDHIYATAGTYTVTATIVSTGCDGQGSQSVTVTGAATPKPQNE